MSAAKVATLEQAGISVTGAFVAGGGDESTGGGSGDDEVAGEDGYGIVGAVINNDYPTEWDGIAPHLVHLRSICGGGD